MQLASHGTRVLPGRVSQRLTYQSTGAGSSRSIHTPPFFRVPNGQPTQVTTAKKLFTQSRTLLSRFVAHLTTPGHIGSPGRSLHNATSLVTSGRATIQQGYSLPVRHAMSRPFAPYHFPKPPTTPRSVFQVGLGTARNFHSARPIFQNLVENVPIAGRAVCETNWEIKMKKEKRKVRLSKVSSSAGRKTEETIKPVGKKLVSGSTPSAEEQAAEFDHYFAPSVTPEITTYLLIPLAPTPSARNPLPASPSPSLLPISILLDIHASHELHSLRVSSLFARLDASQVWTNPGVSYSVYGDPSGLASILKLEFIGWSRAEVRAILGEAGTGWCVLEEAYELETFLPSPTLSGISTPLIGIEEEASFYPDLDFDPATSLVLPSLDLSNHQAWSDVQSAPPSPMFLAHEYPETLFDYDSDDSLDSYDRMSGDSDGSTGGMAMSISSRVSEVDEEPREYMF